MKYNGHSLAKARIKPSFKIRRRISERMAMEIERMYSMGFSRKYIAEHLGISKFSVWLYTLAPQRREEYLKRRNALIKVSPEQRREYSRRSYARKKELYAQNGLTFGG